MTDPLLLCTGPPGDPERYVVDVGDLAELEQGGEGLVVRAVERATGAEVALKMLTSARPGDVAMLRRRAEALTVVRHPNVMYLREVFLGGGLRPAGATASSDDDMVYVVADWIPGRPLTAVREELQLEDALRVLADIACGIEALRLGVMADGPMLHGDLKPSNVRVTPDGSAVLIDVATTADRSRLVGTYGWRAPEVVHGRAVVDPAVDAWGLGALGHWLLTGTPPPLDGEGSARERMAHAVSATPRGAAVADHLAALLRTDPRQRPRDLGDWATGLVAIGAGRAVRTPTASARVWSAVVAVVVLVGGGVIVATGARESRSQASPPASVPSVAAPTTSVASLDVDVFSDSVRFVLHDGTTATVFVMQRGSGAESDLLRLLATLSIPSTWTYGGMTDADARDNCRGSSGLPLGELQRARFGTPTREWRLLLESLDDGRRTVAGSLTVSMPPVSARVEGDACATSPVLPIDAPGAVLGVTVPVMLDFAAEGFDVRVPLESAGRWRLLFLDGTTLVGSDPTATITVGVA